MRWDTATPLGVPVEPEVKMTQASSVVAGSREGQTVRVRLRFLNAASEDLDDVEGSHFAGLTFDPASLATVTRVTDHNYGWMFTGGTPGTGTVQVGYGHDELADEHTFTPADAVVDPQDGGGQP